jgi:checkpoint serine/threonine-protein kinase
MCSLKHCDVKPDNFVLSNLNFTNTIFHDINYSDLTLVDFGSAVDLAKVSDLTMENAQSVSFCGKASKEDMQCIAMRNGQSWSYDVDLFGILCCAHVLLYGKHLEIKNSSGNRWAPSTSIKRYWKKDLWKEIFDTLLNVDSVPGLSIGSRGSSLRVLRGKIDEHLETEARTLRQLLSRQAKILPDSREKIK